MDPIGIHIQRQTCGEYGRVKAGIGDCVLSQRVVVKSMHEGRKALRWETPAQVMSPSILPVLQYHEQRVDRMAAQPE